MTFSRNDLFIIDYYSLHILLVQTTQSESKCFKENQFYYWINEKEISVAVE